MSKDTTQMRNSLEMEKISRTLDNEKRLLEQLLPEHAAAGLREGRAVEPKLHKEVTMFFSDVVGFTSICNQSKLFSIFHMRILKQDSVLTLYFLLSFLQSILGTSLTC